jgi:uncharacterized membrane protein (DUF4010 family)
MALSALAQPLSGLLVATAVGLMVGVQREQARGDAEFEPFGVRSFTLCAVLGNISWLLGSWAFALAFVAVAALVVLGYLRSGERDAGLTTETAVLVVVALGALAATRPALAAGTGVGAALLLAVKERIHRFARSVLSPRDVLDGLLLAAAVLVVMPLLPDRGLGPYAALNPRTLWSMVVLVLAINAAGYVALRAFGARLGLLFTGFSGGFVSSTATIAALSQMSRRCDALRSSCRAGAMLSNASTVIQLAIIIAVLAPHLLARLAPAFVAMTAVAVLLAWWMGRDGHHDPAGADALKLRPFRFVHALVFAGIIALALVTSAAIRAAGYAHSERWVALATGFADVHAASIAVLQSAAEPGHAALVAVALAFASNSLTKCVASVAGGGWRFAMPLVGGIAAMNALFALGLALG